MPGPKPKPTKLKILEGSRGHHGKLDMRKEPQPAIGVPALPEGLCKEAVDIWNTVVPELDRLELLTIVDGTSLEAAVRGAAAGRAADFEVDRLMAKITAGSTEQNDFYQLSMMNSVSRKGWQQWRVFATEFGLTPASRSRISVNPEKTKSGRADSIEAALCG